MGCGTSESFELLQCSHELGLGGSLVCLAGAQVASARRRHLMCSWTCVAKPPLINLVARESKTSSVLVHGEDHLAHGNVEDFELLDGKLHATHDITFGTVEPAPEDEKQVKVFQQNGV